MGFRRFSSAVTGGGLSGEKNIGNPENFCVPG